MPQVELRRDPGFLQRGHILFNFLFALPSPSDATITCEDSLLLNLQWEMQQHSSGEQLLLPVLSGLFGEFSHEMLYGLNNSATAKRGLGFPAGQASFVDSMLTSLFVRCS